MTGLSIRPVGMVRNSRKLVEDDDWGAVVSEIELLAPFGEESLLGIEEFSHAEIVFWFDRVPPEKVETGARHPRNNPAWPRVGIFAQRGKNRPNRIGLTTVRVIGRRGAVLVVEGLDAVDGSPVLDIKPAMREFLPRGEFRQPGWASELMAGYWGAKSSP